MWSGSACDGVLRVVIVWRWFAIMILMSVRPHACVGPLCKERVLQSTNLGQILFVLALLESVAIEICSLHRQLCNDGVLHSIYKDKHYKDHKIIMIIVIVIIMLHCMIVIMLFL